MPLERLPLGAERGRLLPVWVLLLARRRGDRDGALPVRRISRDRDHAGQRRGVEHHPPDALGRLGRRKDESQPVQRQQPCNPDDSQHRPAQRPPGGLLGDPQRVTPHNRHHPVGDDRGEHGGRGEHDDAARGGVVGSEVAHRGRARGAELDEHPLRLGRLALPGQPEGQPGQDDHARVEHAGLDHRRDVLCPGGEDEQVLPPPGHVEAARAQQRQQRRRGPDEHRPRCARAAGAPGDLPDVRDEPLAGVVPVDLVQARAGRDLAVIACMRLICLLR